MQDIQPVVQVLPEQAFFNLFFEIFVGCRHYPDIDRNTFLAANPFKGVVLQNTQEFRLEWKSHFAYLVKK